MRKINYLTFITLLLILSFGCSSDSDPVDDVIEQPTITQVSVFSFSKEFAYVNDNVSINGKNFPTDKSLVEITLDNINVDIISANENSIVIKIPDGTGILPNVSITIPNSTISYDTKFEKIAILENTLNDWIEIEHSFPSIYEIKNFKAFDKEKIYFSLKESENAAFTVYKAFNGGASIKIYDQLYSYFDFKGAFVLGEKGGEYSLRINSLYYKNGEEESQKISELSQNNSYWNLGLFVDSDETNMITSTSEGKVFESNDGGNTFTITHENDPDRYEFEAFYAHSMNQVWLGGYLYPFGENENLNYYPAKILYLKDDGVWYNKLLNIETMDGNIERIKDIKFIDGITGFAIVKITNWITNEDKNVIIKSETKGDTWNVVHENTQEIEDFTFKNKDIGWYISGNEIFKTIDGGISWELNYTNDTECKSILYNQDILWVIANDKILKKYF
ncbi:IPT/TIG domain-containing protein [Tenacibaculum ovolyticum]|uniref:IPT/TIG domain-containing protein n=1 Tax=Tenacibaculum ovolyticum TaxID=104270 RepID=UPI003BABC4DD